MAEVPASAVSPAKLDELSAVTEEYGRLAERAAGWSGVGVGAWIALSELAFRQDAGAGTVAYALGAPVTLGVVVRASRRVARGGMVAPRPDPLVSPKAPGRLWLGLLACGVLVQVIARVPRGGLAGALLDVAVGLALLATVALTPRVVRAAGTWYVFCALDAAMVRPLLGRAGGRVSPDVATAAVIGFALLLAVVGVLGALVERRELRALEARLAFLREHGR